MIESTRRDVQKFFMEYLEASRTARSIGKITKFKGGNTPKLNNMIKLLETIIKSGQSVIISPYQVIPSDLKSAALILDEGQTMTITNAGTLTDTQIEDICRIVPVGRVIFDFTR